MSIVDNLSLSQFDRVVWGQHNDGKSVPQIAKSIGIDKQTVHDTIVDIWRMDKEFVRKSVVFAKAKEFNEKIDEQQECKVIEL